MKTIASVIIGLALTSFTIYQSGSTRMKITVVNEQEALIAGASVEVFKTKDSYKKEVAPVKSGITNKKGYIEFKNLEERVYYILVKKGEHNNHNGHVKTDTLSVAGKNRFKITID
jgi:hypothetical protein